MRSRPSRSRGGARRGTRPRPSSGRLGSAPTRQRPCAAVAPLPCQWRMRKSGVAFALLRDFLSAAIRRASQRDFLSAAIRRASRRDSLSVAIRRASRRDSLSVAIRRASRCGSLSAAIRRASQQRRHARSVRAGRAVIGEALKQRGWQLIMSNRRHESGAGDLPERARCEAVAPPRSPPRDRPAVDACGFAQALQAELGYPVVHDRDQHHHGGEVDLAAKEPQRRRCRPCAAAVNGTAKAEAPVVFVTNPAEPATGLAPVAGGMQHTVAQCASCASRGISKIPVEGEQQRVESGVGQQGLVQGRHPSQHKA